ncbi:MAG: hypothetical protein Q8O58_00130 [Gallionella sp.]|nr:hypothetical protein [Gallionella sp.]
MKYVPSLPPPVTSARAELRVEALTGIKPARPVKARTRPPPTLQPHERHVAPPEVAGKEEAAGKEEKRHDPHVHGERRLYCRRLERLPMLVELRSEIDRRRRNQRASDIAEHIDVEV